MKNKRLCIYGFLTIITILIISIFSMLEINRKYDDNCWMAQVDDNKKITELSIPGTHDSGALHSIFDVSGKCQDLSIKSQLQIGVRFFDIRLQLVNDKFNIVHSFVDQKLYFEDVLYDMAKFIQENNSEFLIVSIKKEANDKNSTCLFEDVLLENFNKYNDIISYDDKLPEIVKQARGKIYVISRYDSTIGVKAHDGWKDSTSFEIGNMYIQDNYCISDIEEKKNDIINTINYANTNAEKLVLNFTSCYLDYGFPPTYAATAARLINPWFNYYINNHSLRLGIVISDFITEDMAKAIYKRNIV